MTSPNRQPSSRNALQAVHQVDKTEKGQAARRGMRCSTSVDHELEPADYNTTRRLATFRRAYRSLATVVDAHCGKCDQPNTNDKRRSIRIRTHAADSDQLNLDERIANSMRFPLNGFTYSLTLFSKFFSSFPHGTCSLSVSCQYLALDGVYHPFWAAFPNNPTHRERIVDGARATYGTVTLYGCAVPSNLSTRTRLENAPRDYNSLLQAQEISSLSSSRFTRRY